MAVAQASSSQARTHDRYAQESLGQTEDALATCDKWVKAMPENAAAFRQRGCVKWKKGDKTEAMADFDKVKRIRLYPFVRHPASLSLGR